jgi:hypothetical protein
MQGVKREGQGWAQGQGRQQRGGRHQGPAAAAAAAAADDDVVLTGVSTAAERCRIARESAIELLDGDASSQGLPPRQSSLFGRQRQLSVTPPSCELLDSASPDAVLRALALADKLADPGLVSLCEAILAARVSEISRCNAFVALASQSPTEAVRLMARADAAASSSTVAGPRPCR